MLSNKDSIISSRTIRADLPLHDGADLSHGGFFIFHHGSFGKPHVLGIITLIVISIAWLDETRSAFGAASRFVATLGYSLTLSFHVIPAFTDFSTRVPPVHPLVAGPDAQRLQMAIGAAFVVFLIRPTLQFRGLRKGH